MIVKEGIVMRFCDVYNQTHAREIIANQPRRWTKLEALPSAVPAVWPNRKEETG